MDESKAKSAIEELRSIVMCLYRSAGNLDSVLQSIELELDRAKPSSMLYTEIFCRSKWMYRQDLMSAAFSGLDDQEAEAWNRLIEAFSKETES